MNTEEMKELLTNENVIAAIITSVILLAVGIWIWIKGSKKKLSNDSI